LFADNPFFLNVFRQLLERGDRTQRNLAIIILPLVNTPESLETLKQFAFGQKGSDDLRNSAALKLAEKGYIGKNVRLWVKGQWMDLKLLAFKINPEAMDYEKYTVQAMKLMEKAIAALKRNDGKTADSILQEVLKIHPDSPSALNNLSMAYELQNRREESYQLVREIHERFPDYPFGRINLAQILLRQGKKEEAFDLIQPILELSELHTTEMSGLARFQIEYYLKIKQKESARYWLEMWNQVDPKCDYEYWEMKINGIGKTLMQSLLGFERKY
jgi:tetratricopeptide (TPR) repeat protein